MLPTRFTAFFDGCCEPINPGGTAGYGAVIFDRELHTQYRQRLAPYGGRAFEVSGMIAAEPTTSNNVAEYLAVNAIFDWLLSNGFHNQTAQIFGDSRLVICQLWGWPVIGASKWKIHGVDVEKQKTPGRYAPHAVEAREKVSRLPRCLGSWIPRDQNALADELSKAELKRAGVEFRIQPEDDQQEKSR